MRFNTSSLLINANTASTVGAFAVPHTPTVVGSIEQHTKADLETLRKNINEAMKQSEQKITADINARQLRMSKAAFKPYLWSMLGISATWMIVITGLLRTSSADKKVME